MTQHSRLPELAIAAGARPGLGAFEVFEYACAPVFDAWMTDHAENRTFDVSFRSVQIDSMILGRAGMSGGAFRYRRDARKIAHTNLDLVLVQFITGGSDTRIVDGQEVVSRPGDIFISDMTRTIETRTQTCRNVTMAIPRVLLAETDVELDRLHDTVLPAASTAGRLFAAHLRTTWRERHFIAPEETSLVATATARLLANLALPVADRAERESSLSAARLMRIRQFIDENFARPDLGPDVICRENGLSRAALYRLFEPLGGVARSIRDRRLFHAFHALTTKRHAARNIGDIARACGFQEMSSFIRAFKARYDMTPSEARVLLFREDLTAPRHATDDGDLLRYWIASIGDR